MKCDRGKVTGEKLRRLRGQSFGSVVCVDDPVTKNDKRETWRPGTEVLSEGKTSGHTGPINKKPISSLQYLNSFTFFLLLARVKTVVCFFLPQATCKGSLASVQACFCQRICPFSS